MSGEGGDRQSFGPAPSPWGRAKSEPKFRDVGGGLIECIRTGQVLRQGPLGKWQTVSRKALRERAAE